MPCTKLVIPAPKQSSPEALSQLEFNFLNRSKTYEGDVDWHDNTVSQLWRYNLHYFDYVADLICWDAVENDAGGWETFRKLALSWIKGNQLLRGDGWHPFTISVRLVNWLEAFSFWKSKVESDFQFKRLFFDSLYAQASILASSLEHDVRGNHLVKNLRGLIYAGIVFREDKKIEWLNRGLKILGEEVFEQVLDDGGHFERVPGYHAAVLKDCLEVGVLLRRNTPGGSPMWLDEALRAMLSYLKRMLPEDKNLPLIKDTAWGMNTSPEELLAAGAIYFNAPEFKIVDVKGVYPYMIFGEDGRTALGAENAKSKDQECSSLRASGYYIIRDPADGDYMIIDAGKVCPDYLPAHAHADMFSYELAIRGKRVVVDSGVYEYEAGPWRDYFRSTRAHNTVEVEGQNQSEVWGSFRVARRAHPFEVSFESNGDHALFHGRHDGYRRLPPRVIHRRTVAWHRGLFWLVVDELHGEGEVEAASHIHLHPSITPIVLGDTFWEFEGLPFRASLHSFGIERSEVVRGQMEPHIQGWYSEEFGVRVPNNVITLYRRDRLPFLFGYVITCQKQLQVRGFQRVPHQYEVEVSVGECEFALLLSPQDIKYIG
ncbi:MAG: alginate lyase family protein [Deltaproteobacteria bacterium]|nr:alginate lyase family protein [Deltaproteobacteria bacterium]